MKKNETELTTIATDLAAPNVEQEERLFELAQRKAAVYTSSDLVPKRYQGKANIGNVMIALNMATRMGADVLLTMQNLYVVHGSPAFSAQFLISCFNSCGKFSAIRYHFSGKPGTDDWSCRAGCIELATGEILAGPEVTLAMAKAEGWSTKAGSKWKTMPELMLRYRSAAFLIRTVAPELAMGMLTREEVLDIQPGQPDTPRTLTVADLTAKTAKPDNPPAEAPKPAEGEFGGDTTEKPEKELFV